MFNICYFTSIIVMFCCYSCYQTLQFKKWMFRYKKNSSKLQSRDNSTWLLSPLFKSLPGRSWNIDTWQQSSGHIYMTNLCSLHIAEQIRFGQKAARHLLHSLSCML